MRIGADGRRILTPEEQKQEFEKWFQCKKEYCEVWGNGDDFYVDDEIKRFCKLGYEQGISVLQAVADKAYCEKANAEIQLDKAKEIIKELLDLGVFEIFKGTTSEEVVHEAEQFLRNQNRQNRKQ